MRDVPKRLGVFVCAIVFSLLVVAQSAFAYLPASHLAVALKARNSLPEGNVLREAMEAQPECMAWGALGPDLPNGTYSTAWGRMGWTDMFHYNKVGTVAQELMDRALKSQDQRQIAFAAGWLTHTQGDMNIHDKMVNPNSGGPYSGGGDGKQHQHFEQLAETWTWHYAAPGDPMPLERWHADYEEIADYWVQHPAALLGGTVDHADQTQKLDGNQSYSYFVKYYDDPLSDSYVPPLHESQVWPSLPSDHCIENLLVGVVNDVFGDLPEDIPAIPWDLTYTEKFDAQQVTDWAEFWAEMLWSDPDDGALIDAVSVLAQGKGGFYGSFQAADTGLNTTQKGQVEAAFNGAVNDSTELLKQSSQSPPRYDRYLNAWNLDAGYDDGRSIGNIVLKIHTDDYPSAGTDDDVYIGFVCNGQVFEYELNHTYPAAMIAVVGDLGEYNDFEMHNTDFYFPFNKSTPFAPSEISQVYLRKHNLPVTDVFQGDDWSCDWMEVYINGIQTERFHVDHTFEVKWDVKYEDGPFGIPIPVPYWNYGPLKWTADVDWSWLKPTSALSLQGTSGNAGWYRSDVKLDFSSVDNCASGWTWVSYSVDDDNSFAPVQTIPKSTAALPAISAEGKHYVKYIATDTADNMETAPPHQQDVWIDKTPPTISNTMEAEYLTGKPITVTWKAEDAISGLAITTATLDGNPITNGGVVGAGLPAGVHTIAVYAEDVAGNSTTKTITFEVLIDAVMDKADPYYVNPRTYKGTMTFYLEFPAPYNVSLIKPGTSTMKINGLVLPCLYQKTQSADFDKDGRLEYALKFERAKFLDAVAGLKGKISFTLRGRLTDGTGYLTGTAGVVVVTDPSTIVPPRVP